MGKIDVTALRGHVEAALEDLLRAADEKVSWRVVNNSNLLSQGLVETVPTSAKATKGPFSYTFLPGVYSSHPSESEESTTVNDDGARTSLILHGDNTFEYHWSMKRNGSRPSEHYVEIHGEWKKPLLNRTRRGEEDQRLFLIGRKIKFQRNSHYDTDNQTWKLQLKTLTRQDSDWTSIGDVEKGIPPINMVFQVVDGGVLESTGAVMASQILKNSPACRVLAGLTKKVASKLGTPIDIMTDKWLPGRNIRLSAIQDHSSKVKNFNPIIHLAEALRRQNKSNQGSIEDNVVI